MSAAKWTGAATRTATKAAFSFPDVCTISGPGASTVDDYGNATSTPTTIAANVPCMPPRALTAQERQVAGATAGTSTLVFEMPAVFNGSALEFGGSATVQLAARSPFSAKTFQVVGRLPDDGVLLKVLVTEG